MKSVRSVRGCVTIRVSIVFASLLLGLMLFCAISSTVMAQTPTKPAAVTEQEKPLTAMTAMHSLPILNAQARKTWQVTMHHTAAPKGGCFHASYPSTQWEEVQCAPPPGYRSAKPQAITRKIGIHAEVGGATFPSNDIQIQAPAGHFFTSVEGSFISATGITSESSIGVAKYGGGGILGTNEYTLQVNTNIGHTAACGSYSSCTAWQQYVMSTNTPVSLTSSALTNQTEVFIEYWLFNYGVTGGSTCPTGFIFAGADSPGYDCIQNTPATVIAWNPPTNTGQLPITDLGDETLSGSATSGGTDAATVTYGGDAYTATVTDSYTDIASIWNQAEFNVVGNAGGSEAQFNNGTVLKVKVSATYGSTAAPTCVPNSGTTGESNNLDFVPSDASPVCCPYGGANPSIEFIEEYDTAHTHSASCGATSIIGDPHITTADGNLYNFQGAGEYVTLLDSDGTEIQTRETPVPTSSTLSQPPQDLGLTTCVSLNTAVAARVGTHRVTYEPNFSGAYDTNGLQLRVDGKVTTLGAAGVNLGDSGLVTNSTSGSGIEIYFPDGKIMSATQANYANMWYLNVDISNLGVVSDVGGDTIGGLAGPIPAGSWIPALPSGASVGSMPANLSTRYNTLYNTFGKAWRVTSSNSLFDYAPGTSTATFTNAAWPKESLPCTVTSSKALKIVLPVAKPVSAAVAEEACKSITDANLHSNCVADVQVTGQSGFATHYAVTERVHSILNIKPILISPVIEPKPNMQ